MKSHGTFCWNELMTHDVRRAQQFYRDIIGWSFDPTPMEHGGTYWIIKMNDQRVGGLFEMQGPDFGKVPDQWVPYLAVDDVDKRVDKAVAAGASVCRPAFDVSDVGRIAMLRQPGDAMIAWITPSTPSS